MNINDKGNCWPLRAGAVDQNKHSPALMHILMPVINIGVYQNTVDITAKIPPPLPPKP
jgi:hypothetical protein